MKFVNLTPHTVVIVRTEGNIEFPSSGNARVAVLPEQPETIGGINILPKVKYGEVSGLPEPRPDTMYIVSMVVAIAMTGKGREDLVIPATDPANVVRDAEGKIIGVKALRRG